MRWAGAGGAALISLLAASACGAEVQEGVYHASNTNIGHYLGALPPEIRVAHVVMPFADAAWHDFVAGDARARGQKLIYDLHDVHFEKGPTRWALRGDWKTRATAQELKVRKLRDVLHSVYLADEPYTNGITQAEMALVNQWWQARGYPTMVVESSAWCRALRPAYSYFGFEPYVWDGGKWVTIDGAKWDNLMAKTGANVLVTQAFNVEGKEIPPQDYQDAHATSRVVLILRFLWASTGGLVGLESQYGPPPPIVFRCPPGAVCSCEGCQ